MPGGSGLFSRTLRFYLRGDASSLLQSFRRADDAGTRTKRAFDRLRRSVQATERAFNRMRRNVTSLRSAFAILAGAAGLGFLIRSLTQFADTMTLARSRLRVVVTENEQLIKVQRRLFEIAQVTRSAYESLLNSYARVARSTKELNVTDEDRLRFIEIVTKAIRISGATAIEASAGLIQFAQALASNRLSGDELRSVFEQLPRLALLIGRSLGVGIGRLREYGEQGKLTADVIFNAVLDGAEQINQEFAQVERTVAQAFTQLRNQLLAGISELDQATGFSQNLAAALDNVRTIIASEGFRSAAATTLNLLGRGIRSLSANLDIIRNILLTITGAFVLRRIARIVTLIRDLRGVSLVNILIGSQFYRLLGVAGLIAGVAASIGAYVLAARDASNESKILESSIDALPDRKIIEIRLERAEEANQKVLELTNRLNETLSTGRAGQEFRDSLSNLVLGVVEDFAKYKALLDREVEDFFDFDKFFRSRQIALERLGRANRQRIFSPEPQVVRESQRLLEEIVRSNQTALKELGASFDSETSERIRVLSIETLFPLFDGNEAQTRAEQFRSSLKSFTKQYDDAMKEFENQRRSLNVRIARLSDQPGVGAVARSTNVFNKRVIDSLEEENDRIQEAVRLSSRQVNIISSGLAPDSSIEALDAAESKLRNLVEKKKELGAVLQEAYSFRDILGGLGRREEQLQRSRALDQFLEDQTRTLELRLERLRVATESLRAGVDPELFEFQARNVFGGRIQDVDEELGTATGRRRTELIAYREELEKLVQTHIRASRATKDFQEAQSIFFSQRQIQQALAEEQNRLDILEKERGLTEGTRNLSISLLQVEQEHQARILKFKQSIQISNDDEERALLNLIGLSEQLRDLSRQRAEEAAKNSQIRAADNLLDQISFDIINREFDLETKRIELKNELYGLSTRESIVAQIRANREELINELIEKRNALVKNNQISEEGLNQINRRIEALQKEIDLINQKKVDQREAAEERAKEISREIEIERRRQRVIEQSARIIARGFERAITRANSLSGAIKEVLASLLRVVIQYTIIDRLQGVLERILKGTVGRLPGGGSRAPGQSTGNVGNQDVDNVGKQEIKQAVNVEFQRETLINARTVIVNGFNAQASGNAALDQAAGSLLATNIQDAIDFSLGRIFGDRIGSFQGGGRARGRRPIVVGEGGPEIFVPDSSGTVIPNQRIRGSGGPNIVIENHFNIETSGGQDGQELIEQIKPFIFEVSDKTARQVMFEYFSRKSPISDL